MINNSAPKTLYDTGAITTMIKSRKKRTAIKVGGQSFATTY